MRRGKTVSEASLFRARWDPLLHLKGLEMGICEFLSERDWSQESCHGKGTPGGVILLLLWLILLLPSLKITAPVFLLASVFHNFNRTVYYTSSLFNTKTLISLKRKKDIPKRKTPFSRILKSLSNKQQLFLIISTLTKHGFLQIMLFSINDF